MSPKTLKVYDIDALLHEECGMEAFRYKKAAVFEGERGIVIAEEEGVHARLNTLSDTICIGANKPASPGKTWLIPKYEVSLPVIIIKTAPYQEMTMSEFFKRRDYNPRCQSNWNVLLSSLSEIGFDLKAYLPDKPSLESKISSAEKQSASATVTAEHVPQSER